MVSRKNAIFAAMIGIVIQLYVMLTWVNIILSCVTITIVASPRALAHRARARASCACARALACARESRTRQRGRNDDLSKLLDLIINPVTKHFRTR